jgi:alpha-beta hydrolase superfamily lysophospholipase
VLIVPGLAEHSGRYERTGTILAATGLEVASFDLEGFGASAGRRAYITSWDVWLDDVADRLATLRAAVDPLPVVLMGHSMGGLVALTYAESDRPQPDLLILSAPWIADTVVPGSQRVIVGVLGRIVPTVSIGNGLDGAALSRDPQIGIDYAADPLAHHRITFGLGRQVIAAQKRAVADVDRVRVPLFVVHGGEDPLVPVASSELFTRLPDVRRKVYPGLRHESLNEPEGPQVAADLAVWIGSRVAPLDATTGAAPPAAEPAAEAEPQPPSTNV